MIPRLNISKALRKDIHDDAHDWIGNGDHGLRSQLGSQGMAPDLRQLALGDIKKHASTRVGPSGETEYLLHRSTGNREAEDNIKGGKYVSKDMRLGSAILPHFTSWSPHIILPDESYNHVVSSWVPESSIAFYPKAYETPTWMNRIKNYANTEKEIFVKPGDYEIMHHTEGHRFDRNGRLAMHHRDDLNKKLQDTSWQNGGIKYVPVQYIHSY
jgi:hypothetical protein